MESICTFKVANNSGASRFQHFLQIIGLSLERVVGVGFKTVLSESQSLKDFLEPVNGIAATVVHNVIV